MADGHWTLDDIPWDRFDRSKVDPDQATLARAAAMVEYNSKDYVKYLAAVFGDDATFVKAAEQWGVEEAQHGLALGRWANLVDPGFDFEARFARFVAGFRPDTDVSESIRGSRAGELVARCMVEVGTSSYYSAMADATQEPVLEAIARHIAADELRHYKLFYTHLKRYLANDRLNKLQRIRVALGRIAETEDDELAYAYYAANFDEGIPYDHDRCNLEYKRRAFAYYREPHIDRSVAMIFKACGLRPRTPLFTGTTSIAKWLMQRRQRQMARLAAA